MMRRVRVGAVSAACLRRWCDPYGGVSGCQLKADACLVCGDARLGERLVDASMIIAQRSQGHWIDSTNRDARRAVGATINRDGHGPNEWWRQCDGQLV